MRAAAGLVLAAAIALGAYRARSLAASGAVAATIVGTLAIAAGWGWGALLIAYFVTSTALSRWRRDEKARRTDAIVEKGGQRDAMQVLANGGAFAVAAVGAIALPNVALLGTAAAGALAAAAADTWATEIGVLAGRAPRSVLSGRRVPAGTSGAVSWPGMLGMVAGAAFVGISAALLGVAPAAPAILGGLVGAIVDTLLGATIQERRWCGRCESATERRVHACGAATRRNAGLAGLDNDWVNVACTIAGAGTAVAIATTMGTR